MPKTSEHKTAQACICQNVRTTDLRRLGDFADEEDED
jgi:hypothetical protein